MKEHWNSKTEGISMTLAGMLAILFYVVLYNRMMAYVESRAYMGTSTQIKGAFVVTFRKETA